MLVSEQVVAVSRSFSALQRAENSSMNTKLSRSTVGKCFSALQRAENSSIVVVPHHEQPALTVSVLFSEPKIPQLFIDGVVTVRSAVFQCSSASRKFLNPPSAGIIRTGNCGFSALQRAENSSINYEVVTFNGSEMFQCSSASRKFLNSGTAKRAGRGSAVSVLFSEPKIPQCARARLSVRRNAKFQCSSASRKFLNQKQR